MNTRIISCAAVFALGCVFGYAPARWIVQQAELSQQNDNPPAPAGTASPIEADQHQNAIAEASELTPEADLAASFGERMRQALSHESERRQRWEIERLFENMTPAEAPELFALIVSNPDFQRKGFEDPFFSKWGEIDGVNALAAAQTLARNVRESMIKNVFKSWARADLAAAWEAAAPFFDDPKYAQSSPARGVLREMARRDPATLLKLVNGDTLHHLNGSIRGETMEAIMETGQHAQLLAQLSLIEDDKERGRWSSSLFRQWAETDLPAATEALALIANQSDADSAMMGFLQGWSRADPKAATDYALEHASDPAARRTLESMIYQTIQNGKPDESAALLTRIEAAGLFDQFAPAAARALSSKDPAVAIKIAETVADADQRFSAQVVVLSAWIRTDFAAARIHYEQTPDETKAKLFPEIATGLFRSADGGPQLNALFNALPASPSRAAAVEKLLTTAETIKSMLSESYLDGLRQAAVAEPNLSAEGRATMTRIFGQ